MYRFSCNLKKLDVYSISPETKKINRVETKKNPLEVSQVQKTSQASLSVVGIATTFGL